LILNWFILDLFIIMTAKKDEFFGQPIIWLTKNRVSFQIKKIKSTLFFKICCRT